MKRMRSVKVAIAALVVVAGVVGYLALLPEPKAMPSPGVCTYYSNAKFRTVVGQFGTGCCGEVISWGVITPYRRCEQVYCLDVWCGPPTE